MGKKVYTKEYSGGWGDPELKKDYQKYIIRSTNPLYKGTKKLLAPAIAKKAVRDQEEEAFLEEMKQVQAREAALIEEERRLATAKKISKLNDSQRLVISEIAKDKKLDVNDPSILKDKDIKDYLNNTSEYNSVRDKDFSLKEEKRASDRLDKAKGFFNPEIWAASLDYAKQWVDRALDFGVTGNSKKEQEKYKKITDKILEVEKPIAQKYLDKVNEELEDIKKNADKVDWSKTQNYGGVGASSSMMTYAQMDKQIGNQSSAINTLNRKKEELEDFIAGKNNIFSGADTLTDQLLTAGLVKSADDIKIAGAVAKSRRGETLNKQEEFLIRAHNIGQQVDGMELDKDRFWYRTGKGTANSLVFMEQMMLTQPVGGTAANTVAKGVTPLAKVATQNLLMKSLNYAEKSLADKALQTLATKGVGIVEKGAIGTGEILTQALAMPSTYSQASEKFIGQTQMVTDKDGNEKVLVSASQRKAYEKEANARLLQLDVREKEIKAKGNLGDNENKILAEIQAERKSVKDALNSIYDPRTNDIIQDVGAREALLYGYIENIKEIGAEKYVGGLVDKVTGVGSKFNRAIGKSKIGKAYNKVSDFVSPVTNTFRKGNEILNNLGNLSRNLSGHTGAANLFHGIPGEVAEEIAVQLAPSYAEDWDKFSTQWKENAGQLTDPMFYVDVIAQTLLMGGAPTMVGTAKHLSKYASDKEYRSEYRKNRDFKNEVRDIYRNIDKAVNDEDLAQHIAMRSGNTLFDINEYQAKVNALRKDGKDKEANELESRSFFNLATNALKSGTLSEFERTLSKVAQNEKLSEATRMNATSFIPKIQEMKKIEEKYNDRVNRAELMNLSINNMLFNDTIDKLDSQILEDKQEAVKYIEHNKRLGLLPEGFSLDFDFRNSINEYPELNTTLARLMEESPELQRVMELQYTKDIYTEAALENTKKLNYQLNPANQAAIKAEYDKRLAESLVNSTNSENVEDNKQEIVENNLNDVQDDEVPTNKMDKKAYEDEHTVPQSNSKTGEVNDEENIEEDQYDGPSLEEANSDPELIAKAQAVMALLRGDNTFESTQENNTDEEDEEDVSLFNAPMEVDKSSKGEQAIKTFADLFSEGGTFKGVIGAMLNEDPAFVDEYYNYIVEGYNRVNIKMDEAEASRIYNQIFGKTSTIKSAMESAKTVGLTPSNKITTPSVTPVTTETLTEVERESTANKSVTIDPATKKQVVLYKGHKTVTPDVKLGYIGQNVNVTEDGLAYENATNEVNEEAMPAIHFENFKPGDKVTLDFNWDYFKQQDKITMYQQNEDGSVEVNSLPIIDFVEKIFGKGSYQSFLTNLETPEGRQQLLSNEEFLGYVPTKTILSNGLETTLGINALEWWNTKNVGLEKNGEELLVERQRQVITKAKEKNKRLRKLLAQGNPVELTVESKEEGFHNTQLLSEQDKENGLKQSSKFQSIEDSFKGNVQAALSTLGFGAMYGNNTPTSMLNKDGKSIVYVGGKEVVLTVDNSNINEYIKSMSTVTGSANGRPFIVYQTGYNEQGNPRYAIRGVITDHESKTLSFKTQHDLLSHLDNLGKILNGTKQASQNQKDKAKKIYEYFKKNFNIDITDYKNLSSNLREYYPRLKANYKNVDNKFYQDFKITNKNNPVLPDITGFNGIADFEAAILSVGGLPTITANEIFMKNSHTPYVFSEISDGVNAPIWTTEVQPKITFTDDFAQQEKVEDQKRETEAKVAQLKENDNIKAQIQEQIASTEDPIKKKRLEKQLDKIEAEEVSIKNELVSEGVNVEQAKKEEPTVIKEDREYGEQDLDTINQHLMYTTLRNVQKLYGKDPTEQQLFEEVKKTFDNYVKSLESQNKTKEASFLKDNRDRILGVEKNEEGVEQWSEINYDGSVIEMISTLFDINPGEALDFTSEFVKDQNKESQEIDMVLSLSTRVKMLLSGIRDTRSDTSDNFDSLPEYFTFKDTMDFLQQALAECHNNSLEDLKTWIFDKVKTNPKEFNFYYDIYRRLRTLKKTDEAFLNEILYFLHQPKVEMTFMMFSQNDSGQYTIQKYDANAKNPSIAKKAKWEENLKTSPLLKLYEDTFYKINEEPYKRVVELYNKIKNARDTGLKVNYEDLTEYFSMFGIKLNFNTLKAMDENRFNNSDYTLYSQNSSEKAKGILASNQIFEILFKNIENIKALQDNNLAKLSLSKDVSIAGEMWFNPLSSNSTKALKRLVDVDNMMSAYNLNSMRIAGKSINPFQQSKSLTNTISKIKNDKEFVERLKDTPITSTSFTLEMLERYPDLADSFSLGTMSLEALKQRGTDSRDDLGPTQLSDMDALVTIFNLFAQNDGSISESYNEDDGVKLRKGSMIFPTLSDSSQQPFLNTFLIDLQKSNFDDLDVTRLSDSVVSILVDKLVKNELARVASFMKINKSTNIKGYDAGAQLINSYSSLNSLLIETPIERKGKTIMVKRPLIEVFKNYSNEAGIPWRDDVDGFIGSFKEQIYDEVRENINHEVSKLTESFTKEGVYVPTTEEEESQGIQRGINLIDNKYLESKGDLSSSLKSRLIAYDYVVNSAITLNEMQNLFAGDTANYFKDKHTKDFEFGLPKVSIHSLAQHYYPELSREFVDKILEQISDPVVIESLRKSYPKLLSATEVALSPLDQRIEDINEIARIKLVNIYKKVQNDLSKRLKELISPGNQYPNAMSKDQKYYQIMLQDVENSSEVLHSLAQRFHPEKYEEFKDTIDEFKKLDDIYPVNRNEIQNNKHEELKKKLEKDLPEISSFLENASTDAQEYSTWQDNLNLLRNQGRVTQEEFDAIFDKLTAQAKDIDEVGYIRKENQWSEEEKDLRKKSVMQVTKPLYSGHHLETIEGENGEYHNHSRYIYIKSSSFALTPELTVGFPKLNAMRKNMEKWQEIDPNTRKIISTIRASYDSANKIGAVKNGLSITELYKENPDLGLIGNNTVELEKSNFYIQQDKPFKGDKVVDKVMQVTRATQFEKILLGDGINKIEEHIFPSIFDNALLEELGIEAKDGMLNGPQLKQLYDSIYQKEQQLLVEKFNRELGIETLEDIQNGKPEVLEKLVDKLKKRLTNKQDLKSLELEYIAKVNGKRKNLNKKELSALQKQGAEVEVIRAQFKIPLYMMPNSNKFESVLNSIINKSNINLKVPGFSSPVGSQEGFDYKGYSDEEFEKAKKAGLITTKNFDPKKGLQATRTEDGKLKYAQVFIANKYKVLNRETNKYEYIDLTKFVDENNQIDTSKFPEELLSMFSFRIPTSSHQSGVIIEVAGFLPHTSADLMIVPKDHTTQIGEDYDIDMRYVYQYNYILDQDGNLKKMDSTDIEKVEGSFSEIKEKFEEEKKKLFDRFFKTTVDTNSPLTNRSVVNNDYWNFNRETILEIAFLKESLAHSRIQDSNIHKLVNSLFEEDMIPEDTGLTSKEIEEQIRVLEARLFTREDLQERGKELRLEYKDLITSLRQEMNDTKSEFKKSLDKYNNAIGQRANEQKVIENNLVSLYKSVFSSNDDRVQKLINKTLSTDNANNTATEMDRVLNSGQTSPYYTFNSPSLQREVVKLGVSGKIGIGEHSNAVTMNSIFQQSDFSHELIEYTHVDENGEEVEVPYNVVLGNFTFDGKMGEVEVNGVRISELAMEDQNSATDNQKLQIMGRRNEDKNTMAVLKILHSRGLDNDMVTVFGEKLSYASLFINQPVIRKYSELVNKFSSVTSSMKGNPRQMAKDLLLKEMENQLPSNVWKKDKEGVPMVGELDSEVYKRTAKGLTSQELYSNLIDGDVLNQYVVLKNFSRLQNAASTYNDMQKLVNIEQNGMGISYFDSISLMETLLKVMSGELPLTNSAKMIGELATGPIDSKNLRDEGYIPVVTKKNSVNLKSGLYNYLSEGTAIWIKPNNHFSHKMVNSIALGYNTYNSVFPYNNSNIDFAIESILNNLNISLKSEEGQKQKYKIVADLKDYIYTNNQSLLGDVDMARQTIFFDNKDEGKQSLASYLLNLSQDDNFADLFRKPFFRDLTYEINNITYPSLIKFNNSDISKVNTLSIYNNFERMMNSNKKLPAFNGKTYTEKELMKDLLKYSLLADQGNGAIGFRQHLPIELFEKYGVIKGINNTTNISGNFQSIAYHGAIKTLENTLGNRVDSFGVITVANQSLTPKNIKSLVTNINKVLEAGYNIENAVSYNQATGEVTINQYDGSNIKSNFVKQYIQHNPKLVSYLAGKKLTKMLQSNGYNHFSLDDVTNNKVKEFYFSTTQDFITIKDGSGRIHLYEQVAQDFFREIPVLGVFGMKEYNIKYEKVKSSVAKNNIVPAPKVNKTIDKSKLQSLNNSDTTQPDKTGINLQNVISILQEEDNQGKFSPLFSMFKEYVKFENVQVVKGPPTKDYKARYFPSGKIEINPSLLEADNFNIEEISKVIAEEMIHHVTVNTVGKYINFTGIDENTGQVSYEPVMSEDGTPVVVPAEVHSLVAVYNYALKKIIDKHGIDAVLDKVRGNNAHLDASTGVGEDTYRVKDIHEFLAGIFMKDEEFAKEMANTPYRNTGGSIAAKFFDILSRFFHRVIPSLKKETVSGEVATSLMQLVKDNANTGKNPAKEIGIVYNTAEKRKAFSNALSLVTQAQQKMNQDIAKDLLSDEEISDEFPSFEVPNDLKGKFDGSKRANNDNQEKGLNSSTNIIKEGVTEVFKDTPELSNIGTPQEYSEYLDTIFPNSKRKEIFYHGTFDNSNKDNYFRDGDSNIRTWNYFYNDRNSALNIGMNPYMVMLDFSADESSSEGEYKNVPTNQTDNSVIIYETFAISDEYAVKKRDQIHILGSQADIQGFKNWIKNNQEQSLNSPMSLPTFAEQAIKCK